MIHDVAVLVCILHLTEVNDFPSRAFALSLLVGLTWLSIDIFVVVSAYFIVFN
jgi:hypothetical protein